MAFTRTAGTITFSQRVAANVRAEAARAGVTNQELAERIGVSPWFMSRRLRGEVALTVDDLDSIATALDVEVTDLLPLRRPQAA